MDAKIKINFMEKWNQYFPKAELPVVFYYADEKGTVESARPAKQHRCIICDLAEVRKAGSLCFDIDAIGCGGAKRYLGFDQQIRPQFEYFHSCGIPGEMEGERYKKSPGIVLEIMKSQPPFEADRFVGLVAACQFDQVLPTTERPARTGDH